MEPIDGSFFLKSCVRPSVRNQFAVLMLFRL